jgi:hypothetical protein
VYISAECSEHSRCGNCGGRDSTRRQCCRMHPLSRNQTQRGASRPLCGERPIVLGAICWISMRRVEERRNSIGRDPLQTCKDSRIEWCICKYIDQLASRSLRLTKLPSIYIHSFYSTPLNPFALLSKLVARRACNRRDFPGRQITSHLMHKKVCHHLSLSNKSLYKL